MEREQSEKNMDTLVNFSNRFVSCLKKYFWINEKMVMKVCKNNTTYWNPDAFLFYTPKDRPHLEIKKNIEIIKEMSSRSEDYNTPKNAQINTVAGKSRLHSEEPLIMAIKSLSYYLENNQISSEILLDCVDLMIEGLTELSKDIKTDNDVDNFLNVLQRFHASKMNQHYGTNANYEKKRYDYSFQEMDLSLTPRGMYQTLFRISEDAQNGDKVKFYINTVFIRLILTRYVNVLKNNQIPFFLFFNDIKKVTIDKDKIVLHKFWEFFSNEKMEIDENDESDAKLFLLSCDIDFWLRIINYVGNIKEEYKNLNPGNQDYMDTITYRLKYYRNVVSHIGDNDPSDEMVVRTLKTLCEFADSCGLEPESILLSKHLVFEQYRCYGNNLPYPIKHRDDMDFTNFQFPKMETIPCWKDVVSQVVDNTKKIDDDKTTGFEKCRIFIRNKSAVDETIYKKIYDYYLSRGIALPYMIDNKNFEKRIKSYYPFHPCFFLLIKNLKHEEKRELVRRAIEKAYNDENYSNPLIMPYEIDIDYEPIYNLLVEKFSTGTYMGKTSNKSWERIKSYLFTLHENENELVEGNTDAFLEVVKIVLLFNLRELFDKEEEKEEEKVEEEKVEDLFLSNVFPNKEWIRLSCYKPGQEILVYEKSLNILPRYRMFIEYRKVGYKDYHSKTYYRTRMYNILFPNDKKISDHIEYLRGVKKTQNIYNRGMARILKSNQKKAAKDWALESINDIESNTSISFPDKDSAMKEFEQKYIKDTNKYIMEDRNVRIKYSDYELYLRTRQALKYTEFDD